MKEKLESSHAGSIAFPWRPAWERGFQMRSFIPARNCVISPPHIPTPHLTSPQLRSSTRQAQEDMLSEGPGPREGERRKGKQDQRRGGGEQNGGKEEGGRRTPEKKGNTERW